MQQMVNCPSCSSPMTVGQKFCGVCGLNVAAMAQQKPNACPTCSTPISPGQLFCGVCGTNLASLNQQQPPMAQQAQNAANISRGAPSMAATGVASAANATSTSKKGPTTPEIWYFKHCRYAFPDIWLDRIDIWNSILNFYSYMAAYGWRS